jgi:hypothetical protein
MDRISTEQRLTAPSSCCGSPERPDESLIEWEQNHQLQLTADEIEASGKLVQVNIKHLVDNNAKYIDQDDRSLVSNDPLS